MAGSEDLDKEYGDYVFHVKGAVVGFALGFAAALLSGGIVRLVSVL